MGNDISYWVNGNFAWLKNWVKSTGVTDSEGNPVMRGGLPCGFDEDEALRRFEEPEKVSCLHGALPSSLRRVLSPISDTVAVLMPLLKPGDESLTTAIRRILWEHHPHPYPAESRLRHPPHASRPDIRPASAPASPVPSAGAENLR